MNRNAEPAGPALADVRETARAMLAEGAQEEAFEFLLAALAAVLSKSRELELLVAKLRRARRSSERVDPGQLALLFEELAEQLGPEGDPALDVEQEARQDAALEREIDEEERARPANGSQKRRRGWRTRNVRREVHQIAVAVEERTCTHCGSPKRKIGADVSRALDYVPGHFVVGRPRRAARGPDRRARGRRRLRGAYRRHRAPGARPFEPGQRRARHDVVHGRRRHRRRVPLHPTGEGASGPWTFLADRRGYIQADAASVFDRLFNGDVASAVEVGCWAHGRRRLVDLLDTDCRVAYPLNLIRRLYRLEYLADLRELEPQARAAFRQQRAAPELDKLKPWLVRTLADEPPSSALAKASGYILNQWDALTRFLDDGRLSLDNNLCERQLRDIALGRKNYLFAGSHDAARRAANLYSLLRTSALYNVPLVSYLTAVLTKLTDPCPPDRLDELLPDRWQATPPPRAPG